MTTFCSWKSYVFKLFATNFMQYMAKITALSFQLSFKEFFLGGGGGGLSDVKTHLYEKSFYIDKSNWKKYLHASSIASVLFQ